MGAQIGMANELEWGPLYGTNSILEFMAVHGDQAIIALSKNYARETNTRAFLMYIYVREMSKRITFIGCLCLSR